MIRYDAEIEKIKKLRQEEYFRLCDVERNRLQNEYKAVYDNKMRDCIARISINNTTCAETLKLLKSTGLFKIAEKKEYKSKIDQLNVEKANLQREADAINAEYASYVNSIPDILKNMEPQIFATCEKNFQMPKKPQKGTKKEKARDLYDIIRDMLEVHGKKTLNELTELCQQVTETDKDAVTRTAHAMLGVYLVRTEEQRKAYFSVTDCSNDITLINEFLLEKGEVTYNDIMNIPQFKTAKIDRIDKVIRKLIDIKYIKRYEKDNKLYFSIIR